MLFPGKYQDQKLYMRCQLSKNLSSAQNLYATRGSSYEICLSETKQCILSLKCVCCHKTKLILNAHTILILYLKSTINNALQGATRFCTIVLEVKTGTFFFLHDLHLALLHHAGSHSYLLLPTEVNSVVWHVGC